MTGTECLTVIDYEDTTKKIFVTTDASDRRTGAVLSFGETWETARPVAYDSYQLNDAEKNYPVHEKELLAIRSRSGYLISAIIGNRLRLRSVEIGPKNRTEPDFRTLPKNTQNG